MRAQALKSTDARLNLGCGQVRPEGWVNVDGSLNLRLSRIPLLRGLLAVAGLMGAGQAEDRWDGVVHMDLTRRLPYPDESVSVVYSCHLLEHLYRTDATRFLRECHRVLKPGGVARHVVPDLESLARDYLSKRSTRSTAADTFVSGMLMREPDSPRGKNWLVSLHKALYDIHSHKWMYDADSLAALMTDAGFREVRPRRLHDSRIADIELVEPPDRLNNGWGVCVEAIR
jgi:SAM-dependent methyltransferase